MKGYGKETAMKIPVSVLMTEYVSLIQGKRGTTIEIGTGLGTGTEEGTGKKTMGVTVTVIVGTEIGIGTVVGIMIGRRIVASLMIVTVREAGIAREIMSVQVTSVTALT